MSAPPALELRNISKWYGANHVLKDVSLSVGVSEVISIIGSSGSGKSTLLRCVNLLEMPDDGEVVVFGDVVNWKTGANGKRKKPSERDLRWLRMRVGMVFQQYNLFPNMTAIENVIEAPLAVLDKSDSEARSEARELLDMVGLSDKMDSYPGQLSGGQQQRVAIARALAMKPRIMLFDEVTSGARPGACRRGAASHAGARRRGHDHAGGHPRDGLRRGSVRPCRLHGRWRDRGRTARRAASSAIRRWSARRPSLQRTLRGHMEAAATGGG